MVNEIYISKEELNDVEIMDPNCKIIVETEFGDFYFCGYMDDLESNEIKVCFDDLGLENAEGKIKNIYLVLNNTNKKIRVHSYINLAYEGKLDLTDKSKSRFTDVIDEVPWSQNNVGDGIDAITNAVHKSAVKVSQKNEKSESGIKETVDAKVISNSNEFSSYFLTDLAGKYTCKDMSFHGAFQYLESIKYSEKSLSIILKKEIMEGEYSNNYEFELTQDARDKIAENGEDGEEFRDIYGDYFVSDVKKGAYFIAIYNCEASSTENMQKFKAKLLTVNKLFDFSINTEFEKLLKKYHAEVSIQIYMHGTKSVMPYQKNESITNIGSAVKWFSNNTKLLPFYIKLNHYSCLSKKISNVIPYETDTLLEVKALYSGIWKLYADAKDVHKNYQELKEKAFRLYEKVMLNLPKIVEDKAYREQCKNEIIELQEKVTNELEAYKIYLYLKDCKKSEPAPGEANKNKTDEKKTIIWEYGIFNHKLIKKVSINIKEQGNGVWYKSHNTTKDIKEQNITIVGYRLISNWTDGTNGDWWKLSNHGLLDHELHIIISSYYGRGYDWTFEYYYIDNSLMDFSN